MTHLVTLKILSSLRARRTLIPNEAPGLMAAQITSKILPIITCEHSLLNAAGNHSFLFQILNIIFCYSGNNQTLFSEAPVLNHLNYSTLAHTLKTSGLIELPAEQDDSPQSQNSWMRSGSSSEVQGHTFSWTSLPETGPGIQTQPGLTRDNKKTHRLMSGLKRASLLISTIQ